MDETLENPAAIALNLIMSITKIPIITVQTKAQDNKESNHEKKTTAHRRFRFQKVEGK